MEVCDKVRLSSIHACLLGKKYLVRVKSVSNCKDPFPQMAGVSLLDSTCNALASNTIDITVRLSIIVMHCFPVISLGVVIACKNLDIYNFLIISFIIFVLASPLCLHYERTTPLCKFCALVLCPRNVHYGK